MISTCSPGWLIYSLVMTFILALAWGFSVGYRRGYIQSDLDSLRLFDPLNQKGDLYYYEPSIRPHQERGKYLAEHDVRGRPE